MHTTHKRVSRTRTALEVHAHGPQLLESACACIAIKNNGPIFDSIKYWLNCVFLFLGWIKRTEMVLTCFDVNGTSSCAGCSSFSTTFPSPIAQQPKCVHLELIQSLQQSLLTSDLSESDTFVLWILNQQSQWTQVIKFETRPQETARFGAVLKRNEALLNNCHRTGVCTITRDMHQAKIRCWSGRCTKIHSFVTEDQTKMCAHARLILSYVEASDPELLITQIDPEDAEESGSMGSRSAGITFDPTCGFWIPDEHCSRAPISFEPEDAAKTWFRSRITIDGVDRTNGVPDLDDRGNFIGPNCVGEKCGACGKQFSAIHTVERAGTILVHTLAGAIARTKWTWDCECGKRVTWDPASEYIHTIRNGAVGGEKALVHVHALIELL